MGQFDDALLFKAIVDQGSLVKAGEQLGINASAVSKRLARLEQQLATQLIRRTTRRFELTESGRYFYQQLVHIDHQWQATWEETAGLGNEPRGTLRIATPQPVASRFLMPRLTTFCQRYPQIRLQLVHEHYDHLPLNTADITICREIDGYSSSTMAVSILCSYRNQLFASPDYLGQHAPPKNLEELSQHHGLVYSNATATTVWDFDEGSTEIPATFTSNNTEILISAAVQGMGIIYIPELLIEREINDGLLTPLLPHLSSQTYRTCAYFNKATAMPQKVRCLVDFLKDELARIR